MKRLIIACLLAACLAGAANAQLANSCWPKFRRDIANTGMGLYGGTGSDLTWTFPAAAAIRSAPAVGVDGTTYFACNDGHLYAVAGNGSLLWSFACNCLGLGSPAIASDGTIYIGSSENFLYAIRSNGTLKWKKSLAARIDSSVSVGSDGTIYFGCTNGTFYAVRADNSTKWTYTAGGAITSSPAIGPDGTIYYGCQDGGVYAMNATGTRKWKFAPTGAGQFVASPTVGTDGVIYIGSRGGFFYAINPSGTQKWRANAGGEVWSSAAISPGGSIYYGCRDYKIHALSSLGAELWTYLTGHYVDSSPAVGVDGGLYVGSLDGKLYSLNPDGTLRWSYDTGASVYSSPAIGPAGALFLGSDNGTFYCFAADDTPPLAPIVTDDGDYTSTLDRIHGSWGAVDPESGIFAYEYCIGTSPGSDNVAPWLNVGGATQHTRTGLSLSDKQIYYISVRATNGAGLLGPTANSDGIIADATPPSRPVITDDGRFTPTNTSLHAAWTAIDAESGIGGYQYSIGTTPGGTNVVGWTDAGTATSVTRTGLSLVTGTTYYINVKARNTGGLWSDVGSSDGITVDATPPSTPIVIDAGEFFSTATLISASWSSADGESGVQKYEYSIGTSAGATNILNWTDAGTNTQAEVTGLSLTNGVKYYVNVRAVNGALLASAVGSSDGITLDTTAPPTPTVTDDGAFTASASQIHASWSSSDPESGIKSYKYAIGTAPGGAGVVGWTDVGTNTSVTRTGLSLVDKGTYYVSVIAVNRANGESVVGSSDGITVDATPPAQPAVTDDGAYTADNASLHATWSSQDAESGLDRYEYSIGTSAGATDVVTWADAGLQTSVTRTGLSLIDGHTYYVNVRAYNTVGLVGPVGSSNGIIVDSVTPPVPTVIDDGSFTSSSSSLHVFWAPVTCTSGIASYEYSIGTAAGSTNTRGWTNVGLATEVTATGLTLANGGNYFVNVRARNTLDRAGFVGSSDGITVDLTPPPTPVVTDGGAFTGSATQLAASWTCADPESGIIDFKYAVGTTPGGTNVLNWTSAGTQASVIIQSLSLADGGLYYISVKATNGAGATGPVGISDGIRVDLTPPSTPTIADDGFYTTNATQLHAVWGSADPQSGIARYECSVGTWPGGTDVADWRSAGTAADYTITGLSLFPGITYYINVRAVNGAGLVSAVSSTDGIFMESTPPTTPVVVDDAAYTQSTTTLHAAWSAEDPETGVAGYEYSIGTGAGLTDVVAWTATGTTAEVTRTDLTLTSGTAYFFNVRATNGIGMVSEVGSSDGITVDTSEPGVSAVTDDGAFTADSAQLHASVECEDAESGIASYMCAIGTSPEGTDVADWFDAGPGPDIYATELSLENGATYYLAVKAINGAGIEGEIGVSDGITIDTTPPTGLAVHDDGAFTSNSESLHGSWSASDPESGVARYRYCIGTAPGLNDVADWLDAGAETEATRTDLSLVTGQSYYITVIATNGAGGDGAPVSSDGIMLDLTPPSTPTVQDNGVYWGYKNSMFGSWQSNDPESGIAGYEMSVGTAPGLTDAASWMSVGSNNSYTRTGLHLNDGVTYYINIRAKNGAGGWSGVGSSDGVLIDSTPPTTPIVTDDGDTTSVLDSLHATWSSSDPESGIAEYFYCLGTSPGATDVAGWTSAGLATDVTVTGLSLDPVLRYFFSVKARSNAGAWSAISASDGIGYSSGAAIWWRFHNDSRNMGRGLFNATTVNDLAWAIQTQGYVESSAAIAADGTSYIGSGDGKIYAITQNGTLRWTLNLGAPIDSSPAVADDGRFCVGCNDGKLYCINPNGTVNWSYNAGGAVRSSPLIKDGIVYAGSSNGSLHAVNIADGTRLWVHATGGAVSSSPAIDQAGVIYVCSEDGYLYAINPNGTRKWRYLTGSAVIASPAIGSDGTVYFGSGDGKFYAINSDGTKQWSFTTGALTNSSPAIGNDGNIYFGTGYDGGDGKFYALQPNGTQVWKVDLPNGGVQSSPAIDPSGMIYFGACNSKMYAYNPDGTKRWEYATGSSIIGSPALGADSSVVFGSYDGKIYCLRDVTSKDLTPPTTPVVTVPTIALPEGDPLRASWIATDPDSMVAEYTYAVGTTPGGSDVAGWTSSGIETSMVRDDLNLQVGQTYYVSVKARNPSQRWSEIGVSPGVAIIASADSRNIGEIKNLDDGTVVNLKSKIVNAVFSDCFFIQEADRTAGIRCALPGVSFLRETFVDVRGTLATVNGEKVLIDVTCEAPGGGDSIKPLGMNGKALASGIFAPTGMLVYMWGKVVAIGEGAYVIDDGCGIPYPGGGYGLEVRGNVGAIQVDKYVGVLGVLCREQVNGQAAIVLRALPNTGAAVFN